MAQAERKTNNPVQVAIPIPEDFDQRTREKIADRIIDVILERTKEGKDKKGAKFPKYSKTYIDSLAFKIAERYKGKSSSKVDLTLSGDMLADISLVKNKKDELVIGYKASSSEAGKAEGNILGSYGGDAKRSRARDFLGLTTAELNSILREFE